MAVVGAQVNPPGGGGGTAGRITGRDVTERVPATVATCVLAYERGATVFRVHDVAAVADALKVADATVAGWPTTSPRTTKTT